MTTTESSAIRTVRVGAWRLNVLGPVELCYDGRPVQVTGVTRTLLALLARAPGEEINTATMVAGMWGSEPPEDSEKEVASHISRLRRALTVVAPDVDPTSVVVTMPTGYILAVEPSNADILAFERLAADGNRALAVGQPALAVARLDAALALWRGPAYADFDDHSFVTAEAARLEDLRLAVIESTMDARLAVAAPSAPPELLTELPELLAQHWHRERLWAQWMTVLFRLGRRTEALAAFRQAEESLAQRLGAVLGPELRAVERAVNVSDPSLYGRAITVAPVPDGLATAVPECVGREEELAWLSVALDLAATRRAQARLIVGSAGIGKTRIVAELAQRASPRGIEAHYWRADSTGLEGFLPNPDVVTLVVIEDLDQASHDEVARVTAFIRATMSRPVVTLLTCRDPVRVGDLASLPKLVLSALDDHAIADIVRVYAPAVSDGTAIAAMASTGGIPARIHRSASEWAFARAGRRIDRAVADATEPTRRLGFLADEVVAGVLDLAHVRAQVRPLRPAARDIVARPYKGLATFEASDAEIFHGRDHLVAELVSRLVERRLLAVVGAAGTGKSSLVRAGLLPALAAGVLPASSRWRQVIVKPGVGGSLAEQVAPHLDDLRRVELNFDDLYPDQTYDLVPEQPTVTAPQSPAQPVPYDTTRRVPTQRVDESPAGELDTALRSALAQDMAGEGHDQSAGWPGAGTPVDEYATGALGDDDGMPAEAASGPAWVGPGDGANQVGCLDPSQVEDPGLGGESVEGFDGGPAEQCRSVDAEAYWEPDESYRNNLGVDGCTDSYPDGGPGRTAEPASGVPSQESILLVVDQFEEVFTVLDTEARATFLDTVVQLAESNWVVLTLRADFYARCAAFVEFAALLSANTVLMPPMTSDEKRRAIELPAAAAGLSLEVGLAEHIVADARGVPGLAHLSTALYALWEGRTGRTLTVDDYEAGGGVAAALENLAENAFDTLSTVDERDAARRIMLSLSTGAPKDSAYGRYDGAADRIRGSDADALVRRRATLAEVVATAGPAGPAALEKLAAGRLITVSEGTVEVVHEALLEHWPRLHRWLDDALAEQGQRRHLAEAADTWAEVGEAGALYRGARLAAALDLAKQRGDELSGIERDFLDASQRLVLAADLRRRRRVVRLWRYLAASIALAILAIVVAVAAVTLQLRASAAGAKADGQRLASLAVAEPDLRKALLLAVAATQLDDGTAETIRTVLMGSPDVVAAAGGGVTTVALSPDGRTVAAATTGGTIWLYGADALNTTGRLDLAGHAPVNGLAFTPDGRRLVSWGGARTGTTQTPTSIVVWDLSSRQPAGPAFGQPWPDAGGGLLADGMTLLLAQHGVDPAKPPTAVAWSIEARTPSTAYELPSTGIDAMQLSSDGRYVILGTVQGTRIVDLTAGTNRLIPGATNPLALSPDGRTLLTADGYNVAVWDMLNGKRTGQAVRHSGDVLGAAWSADAGRFASVGADGLAIVWDAGTLQPVKALAGHGGAVRVVRFGADGHMLYTVGADGSLFAWDLTGQRGVAAKSGGNTSASIVLACGLAGRDMTQQEWQTYLPNRAYRHVCPT